MVNESGQFDVVEPKVFPKFLGVPHSYISPERFKAGNGGWIDPVDNLANWPIAPGSGTVQTYDSINVFTSGHGVTPTTDVRSIKMTGIAGSTFVGAYYDFGVGNEVNLANKNIFIRFYVQPGTGLNDPVDFGVGNNQFKIFLVNGNQLPWSSGNDDYFDIQVKADDFTSVPVHTKDGWYEVSIPVNNFIARNSSAATGGPDITQIQSIYFYGIITSANTPSFTLDRVGYFDSSEETGKYAIRIDCRTINTWSNVQPLAAYAAQQGVKISFGVSPWLMDTGTYLTTDQCRLIELMGHELAIYPGGGTITNNWRDKTPTEKIWQMEYAHNWFKENHFGQGAAEILFVSGGGNWTSEDERLFKRKYLSVSSEVRTYAHNHLDPTTIDTTIFIDDASIPNAGGEPKNATTDGVLLSDLISRCERDRTALIIGAHQGIENDKNSLRWSIDALVASELVNYTFRELHSEKGTPVKTIATNTRYVNVPVVSTNKIAVDQDVVAGAMTLTGTNPHTPRTLTFDLTDADSSITNFDITIIGVDAMGLTRTETVVFGVKAAPGTSQKESVYAYASITSLTIGTVTGTAATGVDQLKAGVGNKLGLLGSVPTSGDVFKFLVAEVDTTVPAIDTIGNTIDVSGSAPDGVKDYSIFYRTAK